MRCYHRTHHADAIVRDGFVDGEGSYGATNVYRGVWVSDEPLDGNEGAWVDVLLALDVPDDVFTEYEWVEEMKSYREALTPAAVLNGLGSTPVIVDEFGAR
jgi:hypothetical protein